MDSLLLGYNPRRVKTKTLQPLMVGTLHFAVPPEGGETLREVSTSAWEAHVQHSEHGKRLERALESGVLHIITPLSQLKLDEAESLVRGTDDVAILRWWLKSETRKTALEFLRDRIEELKQDAS